MTLADIDRVQAWLREPHVAQWWLREASIEAELLKPSQRVAAGPASEVRLLIVEERARVDMTGSEAVGWCQWYLYDADPVEAAALEARDGDCGIDYAIGEPLALRRGLGSQMLAALITEIHVHHPGRGLLVTPEAANVASRRLLERGGFSLRAVRPISTEPHNRPMALYRRDAASHRT